jgi:SAM-dependent methyltransferase
MKMNFKMKTIDFVKFTTYSDIEDIKRLHFIVNSVQKLDNKAAKILDIGCGNGNISLALGALGFEVLGIDIDPKSIQLAASRNSFPNVSFQVLAADSIAMEGAYDAIICSEVLEHLAEPELLSNNIYRILRPGGVLVATVPNGFGPRELLITRPMQFFNINGFNSLLIGCGFKRISFKNSDFLGRIFPLSLLTRRFALLQKMDCALADFLPHQLSSGFYTSWTKNDI